MGIRYTKPPISVLPRFLYEEIIREEIQWNGGMSMQKIHEARMANLKGAIIRYAEAGLRVNAEWVIEYNELLSVLCSPFDTERNRTIIYNETWITQSCLLN